MAVRAKFQVTKVSNSQWGNNPNTQVEVTLSAVYDDKIAEDKRFAKATPSGSMTLFIDNPAASEQLKLGKFFYIDISEVK